MSNLSWTSAPLLFSIFQQIEKHKSTPTRHAIIISLFYFNFFCSRNHCWLRTTATVIQLDMLSWLFLFSQSRSTYPYFSTRVYELIAQMMKPWNTMVSNYRPFSVRQSFYVYFIQQWYLCLYFFLGYYAS